MARAGWLAGRLWPFTVLVLTANGLRFSAPVRCLTPNPPASCPKGAAWLAAEAAAAGKVQSPSASAARASMPATKSYRPVGAPLATAGGTHVQYGITCFAGDHTPVWSHSDVPSSSVAHVSRDGSNWTYTATIASAKDFPWSGEGANEGGAALMSDDKTVVVVMRMGGGDYSPGSACLGYFDYHLSRSSDGGISWSFPEPISGAGAAMPNLLRVGKALVLSGGRMCGNATSDIFLWLNRDGMARTDEFEPFSLSYWHNQLVTDAACNQSTSPQPCRFTPGVNTSCRTETYAGTRLVSFDNYTGAVYYGIHGQYFSMNFTLDGKDTVPGLLRHIPSGTGDKSNCISAHEDMIAVPFNASASPPPMVATSRKRVVGSALAERPAALPVILRVCTNMTTPGSSRHPSTTTCVDSTRFPTDGALKPLILHGANFSGAAGVACRIDPPRGGTIHVHTGTDPTAREASQNYVTFPANVLNDSYAICSPPPRVLAPGPGLLRLSISNASWAGVPGVDGFEVEYFSLVDVGLGKRPYYSGDRSTAACEFTRQCGDDIAHLLVRTNCLAMGETVAHDLCQQQPRVNATLAGTDLAWQWTMIAGDRALPFNVSALPPLVHNDLHVTISYGDYTARRVLRFSRVPRPSRNDSTVPVQVDHFTKTLTIEGQSWVGSGHYFGNFTSEDLLRLNSRLPQMVRDGIRMGVMLTLPTATRSVQSAFFSAAAAAGFKIVYPVPITDSLGGNLTAELRRLAPEPALLGWHICTDCCTSHQSISALSRGYVALKAIDPYHPTFGSLNCDSAWLFSDNPSYLPPGSTEAPTLRPGVQPASQLSLDVPLLQNYGSISTQMGTNSWGSTTGAFRHGIPYGPLGNSLSYLGAASRAPSQVTTGLWLGAVAAELYYSAGWREAPAGPAAGAFDHAISDYVNGVAEFKPHWHGRFGNTRLTIELTNNATLRSKVWYDADADTALVAVVNGGNSSVAFTGKVLQAFNHRMVFATFNQTLANASATILKLPGYQR